jgi:TPP-dependent 2-oxoacid decarboxylase
MDGKFNDIHNWHYEKIVDLMDGGVGKLIDTPVGFEHFLNEAIEDKDQSYVMNVQISPSDMSPVMRSIAQKMCRDQL